MHDLVENGADGDVAAARAGQPDQGDGDGRAGRAALRAHIDAFARALDQQDHDFLRLASERLEVSRRFTAELARCQSWADLIAVQEAWAEAKSQACLLEARWLVLYADLIRHPTWLARQVEAGTRARADRSNLDPGFPAGRHNA